jgi:hypothetical protein
MSRKNELKIALWERKMNLWTGDGERKNKEQQRII